jgi:hypothetical protein
LFDGHRAHGPLGQNQRGGFVTKAHIGQCESANEVKIFRLFFEKRFQVAAGLAPSFLGGGMIAGNLLRPA